MPRQRELTESNEGGAQSFSSPNKELFASVQKLLMEKFINYEPDERGVMDSVIFIGINFNPDDKKCAALTVYIEGSSRIMVEALSKAADRDNKLDQIITEAFLQTQINIARNAEAKSNNDEGTGGQQ